MRVVTSIEPVLLCKVGRIMAKMGITDREAVQEAFDSKSITRKDLAVAINNVSESLGLNIAVTYNAMKEHGQERCSCFSVADRSPNCATGQMLNLLSDEAFEEAIDLLEDEDASSTEVRSFLLDASRYVGGRVPVNSKIRRHRRGECTCKLVTEKDTA